MYVVFVFHIHDNVQIEFLGEAGEDGGGPRREFWTLLAKDIQATLFEGNAPHCILRHDSVALQVNSYIAFMLFTITSNNII